MTNYENGLAAGRVHINLFGLLDAIDQEPTVLWELSDTRMYFTGWRCAVRLAVDERFKEIING